MIFSAVKMEAHTVIREVSARITNATSGPRAQEPPPSPLRTHPVGHAACSQGTRLAQSSPPSGEVGPARAPRPPPSPWVHPRHPPSLPSDRKKEERRDPQNWSATPAPVGARLPRQGFRTHRRAALPIRHGAHRSAAAIRIREHSALPPHPRNARIIATRRDGQPKCQSRCSCQLSNAQPSPRRPRTSSAGDWP